MKKRILLICPHSAIEVFKESKISVVIPRIPYISLAALAGVLLKDGHSVKILDLSISENPFEDLINTLEGFQPDFAGITFTSGLSKEAGELATQTKIFNNSIKTIAGGAHSSIFPREVLEKYDFDFAVFGEGENTLLELVAGNDLLTIKGLAFKDSQGKIIVNEARELIEDLDSLPYPAYYLYNAKNYHSPKVTSRKSPVAAIETSRGCPYSCIFCSKHIFQRKFRAKSAKRVVDEMEIILNLGYKEIHIWDDCFSADLNHAKEVCDEILKRKLKFYWNIYNGIRVDRVDEELLRKLKEAGCYRISFGIESGDQSILDHAKKGVTIEQIRNAVKLVKKVKIEALGFFMIGLPGETPQTINKTIALAKELDLDLIKIGIATPLPGTEFFNEWETRNLIRSHDWADYVLHTKKRIADYPGLEGKNIFQYYDLFYKEIYLKPHFIWKRFARGVKTGEIFYDIYYFLKIFLKFNW